MYQDYIPPTLKKRDGGISSIMSGLSAIADIQEQNEMDELDPKKKKKKKLGPLSRLLYGESGKNWEQLQPQPIAMNYKPGITGLMG